jgi:hypothetical protein
VSKYICKNQPCQETTHTTQYIKPSKHSICSWLRVRHALVIGTIPSLRPQQNWPACSCLPPVLQPQSAKQPCDQTTPRSGEFYALRTGHTRRSSGGLHGRRLRCAAHEKSLLPRPHNSAVTRSYWVSRGIVPAESTLCETAYSHMQSCLRLILQSCPCIEAYGRVQTCDSHGSNLHVGYKGWMSVDIAQRRSERR